MDKGAHFYRCDFQVHTPRDRKWSGVHHVSDEDRRTYAMRFIDACREKNLHAVAITDHNDLTFVQYIRDAACTEVDKEGHSIPEHERIVVFPGIELTLNVPCQAILVFDSDLPEDLFPLILTALAINPNAHSEKTTGEVERLEQITTLEALKDELNKHKYLKNRYIILPNVSDSGSDTLLRKGGALKYKSMPCEGGYLDGGIEQLGKGNRNIIDGKSRERGNKRIAVFQTSDSRDENHDRLGIASTWVKWATPTAEAIRQACLAQESRISQVVPQLPAVAINSISVSNSKFLGPIELELNSQYNAIIGGRGTGKSTILEYLRWALCDQPPLVGDGQDIPNYDMRRQRLIEETLKPVEATVDVKFEVNGMKHLVRRESLKNNVQMKIGDQDLTECTEEDVRKLLPIQAYSQKQLSNVSVRMDELLRFVISPIRVQLSHIEEQLANKEQRIREAYTALTHKRVLSRTLEDRKLEEDSLAGQAAVLKKNITGLSDEDRSLLDNRDLYTSTDRNVRTWREIIATFKSSAEDLQRMVEVRMAEISSPTDKLEAETIEAIYDEIKSLLGDSKNELERLIVRANAITMNPDHMAVDSPWRSWIETMLRYQQAYDAALEHSTAHEKYLDQLKKINTQYQEHLIETERVRSEFHLLKDAETTYDTQRKEWQDLLRKRDDLLEQQCKKLSEDSGFAIRARVRRFADTSDFLGSLKSFLSGSRIPSSKLDNVALKISDENNPNAARELWQGILGELEILAEYVEERDGSNKRPAAPTLTQSGLTDANLDAIGRLLKPSDWLSLSLQLIEGKPEFEYCTGENEYMPFRNASSGQQATALLKTLLNQPGSPLIIDQPEEDLDNPVILEVVELLWRSKQNRQLVFASHNANLVVNGDAELVVWCDYRTAGDQSGGKIAGEGAIDVENVRDAIKRIMEGGEQAFNLRRAKYGF